MGIRNNVREAMLKAVPSLRAFAISLCGNVDRADDLAVPPEERTLMGGKNVGRRRRLPQRLAKAVDLAALQVDAGKQRSRNAPAAFREQPPGLLGSLDVSGKQDHAGRLCFFQQGAQPRIHLGRIEAKDQQLSDFCATGLDFAGGHGS